MSVEVKVPILPESVAEATVAAWHKQVGDAVSIDENLVDIETEKVVLEVPSTVDGVLKEIRVNEGATVGEQDIIAIRKDNDRTRGFARCNRFGDHHADTSKPTILQSSFAQSRLCPKRRAQITAARENDCRVRVQAESHGLRIVGDTSADETGASSLRPRFSAGATSTANSCNAVFSPPPPLRTGETAQTIQRKSPSVCPSAARSDAAVKLPLATPVSTVPRALY